ncbi:hypothetical protein FT662_00676 [Candidozyma haemuli var. vulneris]|nr:hypothetical protein FT662_00676 [[Candida] haemuloni var. vulneris]
MNESNNVKVIVRLRPPLPREEGSDECLVEMPAGEKGSTILKTSETASKKYIFDECVYSYSTAEEHYMDNADFYRASGPQLIEHFFQGYNVCLLAYGQTGSGKTYTMMGHQKSPGLIPLMVRDILRHKEDLVQNRINCELCLSYVEIYNEKVKDLLNGSKQCRVREHPTMGSYVEGLAEVTVGSYEQFMALLDKGNGNRTVASTQMNVSSSRSHAVITLSLKQTKYTSEDALDVGEPDEEVLSSIRLVDLAGSERLHKTGSFGQADRMKEGTQINKSLTVLGRCINILAQNNPNKPSVVPYRDSILTYLLRETLAGNSKTAMIFCVSPFDYEETQQTLNYANQVKNIKTRAKANTSSIASAPIEWEKFKEMDKSVVETLKDRIRDLTEQLDEARSDTPVETASLIKYLDREAQKQNFEVKYLKSILSSQNRQVEELKAQNTYLHKELLGSGQAESQRRKNLLKQQMDPFIKTCALENTRVKEILSLFDPEKVL